MSTWLHVTPVETEVAGCKEIHFPDLVNVIYCHPSVSKMESKAFQPTHKHTAISYKAVPLLMKESIHEQQ